MVLNRDQWDFGAILLISSGVQADNFQVPDNTLGIGQPDPRLARLLGQ